MTIKVQHKRSAVKGKAPLPTDLEYGEIAVNYEATDPALYVKDSADAVRRIGIPEAPDGTADGTVQYARQVVKAGAVNTKRWVAVAAIGDATETAKGILQLATVAETTAGTDATKAVHPAGLKVELDKKAPLASPTFTGTPNVPTAAEAVNTTQAASTAFVHTAIATALTCGANHLILTEPDGAKIMMAWGYVVSDGSGVSTFTFPKPFAAPPILVASANFTPWLPITAVSTAVKDLTATGSQLYGTKYDSGGWSVLGTLGFGWIAIGTPK
jgi:hypothetical protein